MKINLNYDKYWGAGFNQNEEKKGFAQINSMLYNVKKNIDDYRYLSKYSNDEIGVWVDEKDKTLVIGLRGSVTAEDWLLSDLAIATDFGFRKTPRFTRNQKQVENIVKNFPKYKLVFTGHSLGGKLAEEFYDDYKKNHKDIKVFLYNRGTGFIEEFDENEPKDKNKKHYHAVGDPLSYFYTQDNGAIHKLSLPRSVNVHGVSNFTK